MWTPIYSNCNIFAWESFRRGHTERLVLQYTEYSLWARIAKSPLWRFTLTPLGYVIGYPAWAVIQICWFLIGGRWAHVTTGTHEYVPIIGKRARWLVPLIFKGKVQLIECDS